MQLEALQLLRNQRQQGFEGGATHEDIETKLAGYRALRVRLTNDGHVHSLSAFSREDELGYWSLKGGTSAKKKRFPALRLSPLTALDEHAPEWEALERVGGKAPPDGTFSQAVDLLVRQCEKGRANDLEFREAWEGKAVPLLSLGSQADPSAARVLQLVHAFGAFTGLGAEPPSHDAGAQREDRTSQLLIRAKEWLVQISDMAELETAVQLIVGKRIKKKGRVERIDSVQLCLDIYEPKEPLATVYTARTRLGVSRCLPKSTELGVCGLTNHRGPLIKKKFPTWTGKVAIYSKNPDAPCNERYGRAGLEGFPVSEEAARAITGALTQMIEPSREGKTWTFIYNGKGQRTERGWKEDRGDWLLAYPSFPVEDLHTIDIFQQPVDDLRLLKRFEDLAETLCSRLQRQATSTQEIPSYLQVLLIRKVSEGQVQVVFADNTPVSRLSAAVSAWRVSNLPLTLRIPMPSRSGNGLGSFTPHVLFPAQIARLLSHQWVRSGTESSRIEGPPIGLVFELFLRKPGVWEQDAAQLLELALARVTPLLRGLGQLLHLNPHGSEDDWREKWLSLFPRTVEGKPDWKKVQPGRSFVDSVSLIGSLLYAMNSTVGEYTNESAYLLGKLLAMMDELHRCYCVAVREGALPPSLIGNGLLGRAADAPALAIEELLDRSRIYLGWAKTAEPPTDPKKEHERIAVFSARKVLRLAGPLGEQLHGSDSLNDELSPVQKAHLFLGYLSPVLGGAKEKSDDGDDPQLGTEASTQGGK